MTVTTSQVLEAHSLLLSGAGRAMPGELTYRVRRNLQALRPTVEAFDETRADLVRQHADIDAEGRVSWHEGGFEAANSELNEVLLTEHDADALGLRPVRLSELGDLPMTVAQMDACMGWLLTDDYEPEPAQEPKASEPEKRRGGRKSAKI